MWCKFTKNILITALWLFSAINGYAQQTFDFAKAETELVQLFETVSGGENQHLRYNANERFLTLLKTVLNEKGAFDYSFERLLCQKLMPEDQKFRLFNWAVRKDAGMEFFAVLMVYLEQKKIYQIIELTDNSDEIFDLPHATLDKEHWFGAYYSEVIHTKTNGQDYYTLLGWHGNNPTANLKLIEILTFKPDGEPVFGAPVFAWGKEKLKRKVFEYSRQGTMVLRYDYQAYKELSGTKKNGRKQKEKLVKANMIIFDRLMPPSPEMSGNTETFIAGGGIYDALAWHNGKWTLKTDVEVHNPEPPKNRKRATNRSKRVF